ncbi:MAG: ATP-binding protein [Bacteroidetes bacterium]|nr:ATP-binding protein [Bacteroidota bacterium]
MQPLKKIAIIGPESTGKSSLCELLARHYQTKWVPEYAREYLLARGKEYTYDDLLTIAKGQIALEDKASRQLEACGQQSSNPLDKSTVASLTAYCSSLLLIDTDMYVMKVWCEFVFGKCHQFIIDQIAERKYDLYLLCCTDLPWVQDELREYPDPGTREKLFHIYKDLLINQSTPWAEIKGGYEERLRIAIDTVDRNFAKNIPNMK